MNTPVTAQTSTEPESPTTEPSPTPTSTEPLIAKDPAPEFTPVTADDFPLPEGAEIDEESMTSFIDLVNTEHVSKETAEKFLAMHNSLLEKASEQISQTYESMQTQWQTEARNDPEIGGAKLAPALAQVKQMIMEVSGPDADAVFEALDLTGGGNHPALIKLFSRLARNFSEGTPTTGTAPAQNAPTSRAERMFPNQGR